MVFLSVKASMFDHFEVSTGLPVSPGERRHKITLPLLLVSSALFSLLHIFIAYRTRCQARRKLSFDRLDMGSSARKMSMTLYQHVPRVSSPTYSRTNDLERNVMINPLQDDDKDVPAYLLADYNSLFMDLKGLSIHYKLVEVGTYTEVSFKGPYERDELPQYSQSLTSENSSNVMTAWNPLVRSSTTGSMHLSVQVPLLSGYAGDDYSVYGSTSWRNGPATLNGWQAILQETHQGSGVASTVPFVNGDFDGNSPGVIFIHGFGGGVFSWRHVMATVAREVGCRVVAFDRPGWGLTSRPQRSEWEPKGLSNPYELQTQVDLLFAFCQRLGFTSVVLVGHSDGGVLALMAAAMALESRDSIQVRVEGVVLVGVSFDKETVSSTARVLLQTRLGRHMLRPLLRSEIAQVTTRRAWHDASKLTSETLDFYKAPLRVENWDKAMSEVCKATSATAVLSTSSAAELVRCVSNLPVLVVAGSKDNLVPIKTTQSLASQLPNSRLVLVPNCGHLPHEECPDALLSAMIPFMTKHLHSNAVHPVSRSGL